MKRTTIFLLITVLLCGCTQPRLECEEYGKYLPMRNGVLETKNGALYELIYNDKDSTHVDCTKVTILTNGDVIYFNWEKRKKQPTEDYRKR